MPEITDLSLTGTELAQIAALWPDETGSEPGSAFTEWQRSTLAAEIERRTANAAAVDAQVAVADAVQEARAAFPTVFEQPAT